MCNLKSHNLQHENENLNNTVKELKERLMLHAEDSDDELFTDDNITRKLIDIL